MLAKISGVCGEVLVMSKTLNVQLGDRSYPVHIGKELLSGVGKFFPEAGIGTERNLFLVTDTQVASIYEQPVTNSLRQAGYKVEVARVESGEQAKQLSNYESIVTRMLEAGCDRSSVVLALGGGVVGDLAGFVAATYMRGIPFVQLPTTLLAHDSSVGGKVAINHPLAKNVMGAFHQPLLVIYDVSTLKTLPPRELSAGFAEVVKEGLIRDASFVTWLEQNVKSLLACQEELLAEAVYRGCSIKAEIVSQDEREQGVRAHLNLGHTFGHAFEVLLSYSRLNHGEAVSIGMVLAARLAEQLGIAPSGIADFTRNVLRKFHLPTDWPAELEPSDVLSVMRRDKKVQNGKLRLVLPVTIGAVTVVDDVKEEDLLSVMKDFQWECVTE